MSNEIEEPNKLYTKLEILLKLFKELSSLVSIEAGMYSQIKFIKHLLEEMEKIIDLIDHNSE